MKPLSYIDRIIQSREFQELGAKAEAYLEGHFRTVTPAILEAHAEEAAIKVQHEGNKP